MKTNHLNRQGHFSLANPSHSNSPARTIPHSHGWGFLSLSPLPTQPTQAMGVLCVAGAKLQISVCGKSKKAKNRVKYANIKKEGLSSKACKKCGYIKSILNPLMPASSSSSSLLKHFPDPRFSRWRLLSLCCLFPPVIIDDGERFALSGIFRFF